MPYVHLFIPRTIRTPNIIYRTANILECGISPFKVLYRTPKYFKVLKNFKDYTVSVDRLKAANLLTVFYTQMTVGKITKILFQVNKNILPHYMISLRIKPQLVLEPKNKKNHTTTAILRP